MHFKIPQDVEIEDRIMSFLTVRQLIILTIGGGIAYLIFLTMSEYGFLAPAWGPIVLIISLITILIAFLRLNYLPFHRWIILLIGRIVIPQQRYWSNRYVGGFYFQAYTDVPDYLKKGNNDKTKDFKNNGQQKLLTFQELIANMGQKGNKHNVVSGNYFDVDDEMKEEIKRLK